MSHIQTEAASASVEGVYVIKSLQTLNKKGNIQKPSFHFVHANLIIFWQIVR